MCKIQSIFTGLLLVSFASCFSSKTSTQKSDITIPASSPLAPESNNSVSTKPLYDPVQIKYAQKLNVSPDKIQNLKLYKFMDKWMNTPYRWGGDDNRGIDCSAFVQRLLSEVYGINISRTAVEQFLNQHVERFGSKQFLSEGDVVFFRTRNNTLISHVGLFLHNNKFLNSSSSQGVSIASLDDPYWKKCYVAAGRLK